MDFEEIKRILDLEGNPNQEELESYLEEEVFRTREYFLRQPVVKLLFNSRIRRVKKLNEARLFLASAAEEDVDLVHPNLSEEASLENLLRSYETQMAFYRKEMSATLVPNRIIQIAEKMVILQDDLESQVLFQGKKMNIQIHDGDVKAADQIETGVVLRLIANGDVIKVEKCIAKEVKRIEALRKRL